MALRRAVLISGEFSLTDLFAAGVLGDSLCAFADSVLGQFTGKEQSDGGLNLSAGDCGSLVVVSKAGSFSCDSLKDVIHETVHDRHSFAGDSSVRVHLFQNFVDVDSVGFLPPPLPFLVTRPLGLCLGHGLLGSFTSDFGWHV